MLRLRCLSILLLAVTLLPFSTLAASATSDQVLPLEATQAPLDPAPTDYNELWHYHAEHYNLPADMTPFADTTELAIYTHDLTPLAALPNLRRLTLTWECDPDLAPLASLPSLEALDLREFFGEIDWATLAALPRLTELVLPGESLFGASPLLEEGRLDLAPLPTLPHLAALTLTIPYGDEYSAFPFDWAVLSHLPGLQKLTVNGLRRCDPKAQAEALNVFAALPALRELELNSAPLELDYTPLNALDLDRLALHVSDELRSDADLTGLLAVPGWTELSLTYEPGVSLAPLAALPRLQSLTWDDVWWYDEDDASVAPLDLAPLTQFPALRSLSLSVPDYGDDAAALDLSPLSRIPGLRELSLGSCTVDLLTEFLAGASLPQLESLTVSPLYYFDEEEHDLSLLAAALPNLKSLSFEHWPADLTPLQALTHLERLDLGEFYPDLTPLLQMQQLRLIIINIEGLGPESQPDLWARLSQDLPDCEIFMYICDCMGPSLRMSSR